MKKLIILIIACLLLTTKAIPQLKPSIETNSKTEKIESLMRHCFDNGMFNGTILVSEKGSVIYRNSFGYANPVTKEPLNNKSVFYLASLSKQFTAMAIMMLREKNKLSYNDKLSKYFPEFPAYANEVTIRHLLTHTSGIPDHYRLGIIKTDLKNSDVLAALIKQNKLDFKPGEKFSYSNGGYVLLALIVEKVSGVSLSTYLQNNIFKPLKMSGTLVYDESKPAIMNRVVGSNMFDDIDDYQLLTTGAGGMFSTIDDMSIWDRALYTEKLVSQKTLGEAYALTVLNDGTLSNYGFGWVINELGPNKLVAHSGSMAGFRTQISRDLTNRTAYIILTNKGNTVPMNEIARGIEGILNDTEYALPKAKISSKLYGYLKTKSVEEAINRTRSLVKDQPDQYQIDEQAINALGYHYLQEKKIVVALAIFKLNIEFNPESSNVFDSMGEAYLLNGDTSLAIANYKKSIQLNPGNTNGKQVLQKLGVQVSDLVTEVVVPIEVLDTYVGKYELSPSFIITVTRKVDQLIVQATGQPAFDIFPSSQTKFYLKAVDAQLTFNKGDTGEVTSLTLHQAGNQVAKKIE